MKLKAEHLEFDARPVAALLDGGVYEVLNSWGPALMLRVSRSEGQSGRLMWVSVWNGTAWADLVPWTPAESVGVVVTLACRIYYGREFQTEGELPALGMGLDEGSVWEEALRGQR